MTEKKTTLMLFFLLFCLFCFAPNVIVVVPAPAVSVDECTDNMHNCDAAATCTDATPGFSCDCNMGFEGPGTRCINGELVLLLFKQTSSTKEQRCEF